MENKNWFDSNFPKNSEYIKILDRSEGKYCEKWRRFSGFGVFSNTFFLDVFEKRQNHVWKDGGKSGVPISTDNSDSNGNTSFSKH